MKNNPPLSGEAILFLFNLMYSFRRDENEWSNKVEDAQLTSHISSSNLAVNGVTDITVRSPLHPNILLNILIKGIETKTISENEGGMISLFRYNYDLL